MAEQSGEDENKDPAPQQSDDSAASRAFKKQQSPERTTYTDQNPEYSSKHHKQTLWARWKKVSLPNKLTVICTAIIAIATVLYTVFAYHQWKTMARQLNETERQTKAAITSADAAKSAAATAEATLKDSQKSFIVQNRPYINFEVARLIYKPEVGKRLEATCLIRNSGRTPAISVRPDISIEGRTDPLPKAITRLRAKNRIDLGAGQSLVIPVPGKGPIRSDSAARIEAGEVVVYVYGFLDYSDLFGCQYTLEFCGFYDPKVDSENPLMLLGCSEHNRRIEHKCDPK